MILQRKPEPGRNHFMQRMRAMFPNDWPCGSPDETRFQLHRLTEQGLSLALRCRTEEILVKQPSEMKPEVLGGEQSKSPSSATLEQLQLTAAELHVFADKVKREWKAWDRWRPEGGCLCPSEAAGVFGNRTASPLPLTITYRTEPELQLLERLRMRVALLQQEIHLEQVSMVFPLTTCENGSLRRSVPSAFIHQTWTWMSQPQCAQRHILAAGRRRGAFCCLHPRL
ncbi:uncharacterized protein LOC124864805 isoform X3 [Girardinichthys multiradiatus]|uniref:uncharacterized protein LOC124864805 isoform X3 n=1 Tax=Girardinichthys multiradiatus TaxID=208333 RepID=UPI001FAC6D9C|nr:uncharacterized protein LOC124864805 isoform X3 [Girardinichthys multiradiatus]